MGVSDGVGGWADYGVTAADFSEALMTKCSNLIRSTIRRGCEPRFSDSYEADSSLQDSILFGIDDYSCSSRDLDDVEDLFYMKKASSQCVLDPSVILGQAYRQVNAIGSATAVLCAINSAELICANIGDSGFVLVRFADCSSPFIVLQSDPQQHGFNTPYQLAKLPSASQIGQKLRAKGLAPEKVAGILAQFAKQEFCSDCPEAAKLYQTRVQEGDLLLVATDGVFDNLFPEEILHAVQSVVNGRHPNAVPAQEIANEIAGRAYGKSKSSAERSPFSEALSKLHGFGVLVFWCHREK